MHGRKGETERISDRARERWRDADTQRQGDTETGGQGDEDRDKETERWREKGTKIETKNEKGRWTGIVIQWTRGATERWRD